MSNMNEPPKRQIVALNKNLRLARELERLLENSFDSPNEALLFLASFCHAFVKGLARKTGETSRALRAFASAVEGTDEQRIVQ